MIKIGLLGEKLSHSLSPILHKIILKNLNIQAEYVLYEVSKEDIINFKEYMQTNNIKGVNITIPYKKIFIDKLNSLSNEAKEIGAINLLYIKDNKYFGANTDYYGFMQTLVLNNIDVKNKKVAVIGRGGASASVSKVLKDMRAGEIIFCFRKDKNSKVDFSKISKGDIIINTTPVGMYPNIDESIADENIIKKFKVAIDLIYNPIETKFLKLAKENGLVAINGMDMLIEQAIKTDEILFEKEISEMMKNKIREEIIMEMGEKNENNGN